MTEYTNPNKFIFKDLKLNAPINNISTDGNLTKVYNNKITENTLSYNLNADPLNYYNRYKQYFKNKTMDTNKGIPIYDYEANGGRIPQYFISNNKNWYKTPPLERSSSRY